MVARTPPKERKMAAALDPVLLRETLHKMDRCMERLQELQSTVTGGKKVVAGVSLSPRSSRGYLKTSIRCKQEPLRMKTNTPKRSPVGKFPANTKGDWQRMSLPAMLLGETVTEILQASQFAREIVAAVSVNKSDKLMCDDPKTPLAKQRKHRLKSENTELAARRRREKQVRLQSIRSEEHRNSPALQRVRSRIRFKPSSPLLNERGDTEKENYQYLANRIAPRNLPWAKKAVLFPNPLFHPNATSDQPKLSKTMSPVVARNRQTPHKFLIKSPTSSTRSRQIPHKFLIKSPTSSTRSRQIPHTFVMMSPTLPTKMRMKIKSPIVVISPTTRPRNKTKSSTKLASTASRLRRSLSPARLANRLVSPLRSRKGADKSEGITGGVMQRPILMPLQFSTRRI